MTRISGVLLMAMGVLAGPGQGQECDSADALLTAGQLEEARKAYVDALTNGPGSGCAISGVERVAAAYLTRGEEFLEIQLEDSASANFLRAIALSPNSQAAWEAQRHLLDLHWRALRASQSARRDSLVRHGFSETRALAAVGLYAEAREALKKAIAADPSQAVPRDLLYLVGGPSRLWRGVRRSVEPWIRFSPELAALFLVTGWLLAMLVSGLVWKPRLTIDSFETESIKDAPRIGGGFGVMLGTLLSKLVAGEHNQAPQWIEAPVGPTTIPAEVQNLVPGGGQWVEAALKIVRWINPRGVLKLGGHLHASDSKGLGVTIQLRRRNRFIAGSTLWLADLWPDAAKVDPRSGYPALAEVAAAWLLFNLPQAIGHGPFVILGTRDWRAFALFRLAFHQRSTAERATMLVKALQRDVEFAAALANLGNHLFNTVAVAKPGPPDQSTTEFAKGLLTEALEVASGRSDASDPTRYSTLISLVSVCSALGENAEALKHAEALRDEIDKVTSGNRDRELVAYVGRMRPTVDLMIAVLTNPSEVSALAQAQAYTASANTQYSMASAWSLVGAGTSDPAEQARAGKQCLLHLERCFVLDRGALKKWAAVDWSLDWVRTAPQTKKDFDALVLPPPVQTAPPSSRTLDAGPFSVSKEHERRLGDQGIQDWDGLLLRAGTSAERRVLASNVGVPIGLVEVWAHLADLQRVVGLRAKDAGLLQLSGVGTVSALAAVKSRVVLADTLQSLAVDQGVEAPTVQAISGWIQQATTLVPMVL